MKRSGSVVTLASARPGLDPSAQSGGASGRPSSVTEPAVSRAMTGTKIFKPSSRGSGSPSVLPATQAQGTSAAESVLASSAGGDKPGGSQLRGSKLVIAPSRDSKDSASLLPDTLVDVSPSSGPAGALGDVSGAAST
jgi:hypothetical protein